MNLWLIILRLRSADKSIILTWEAKFCIHQIIRTLLVCNGHQKFLTSSITPRGGYSVGGVQPATQNHHPIYDQNQRFSLTYLWLDQKFDTLFVIWLLDH